MRLENKIAIVTGAAQGIGRGIALEFAKEGADMMIMDLNGERLAETAKEIEALGRKVETFVGNVADEEAIVGCVNKTIETFGRIDILMPLRSLHRDFYEIMRKDIEIARETFIIAA